MALPTPSASTTAVVTGASSGIGTELARVLARKGHHVTLVARRRDALEEVAADLPGSAGSDVVTADLADETSRNELVDALTGGKRKVAVLVNNAGFSTVGPVTEAEVERELSMVRTNVEAVVHLCAAFVPAMAERGAGAVLNVASTAAFQPIPGQAGYGATKAFVLSYTQAIRAEVAGSGVTVTALCPGPVKTNFAEAAGFGEGEADSAMPAFMWVEATAVAEQGIAGLERNRMVVIPGVANRVTATLGPLVPRTALLPVMVKAHPGLRNR
jgi:short-subunit dehydrogenase